MDILAELGGAGSLTAGGLVLLAVWLIFTGRLVPARYYNELRANRDEWQGAAEKALEANAELLTQNTALIRAGRTTQAVLEAIPPKGGEST